jgi:hypothetical protein
MFWDEFDGRWLRHNEFFSRPARGLTENENAANARKILAEKSKVAVMKTEQHVSQMGADLAIQLMLSTMFRFVADLSDDPDKLLVQIHDGLLELAASHPLPELPAGDEETVRDAARIVITGVMANAGSPQTH